MNIAELIANLIFLQLLASDAKVIIIIIIIYLFTDSQINIFVFYNYISYYMRQSKQETNLSLYNKKIFQIFINTTKMFNIYYMYIFLYALIIFYQHRIC